MSNAIVHPISDVTVLNSKGEVERQFKAKVEFNYAMELGKDGEFKVTFTVQEEENKGDTIRTPSIKQSSKEVKIPEKVVCIDNRKGELDLTVGKVYEVLYEMENEYLIKDDLGTFVHYNKSRFEPPTKKTVFCVDNMNSYHNMTLGKEYVVLTESEDKYYIENDKGMYVYHNKFRFTEKENVMVVRCNDNTNKDRYLTVGDTYPVFNESDTNYTIVDDSGSFALYEKWRFEKLKGENEMNKKSLNDKAFDVNEPSRTYFFPSKYGIKEITVKNVREVRISDGGTHRLKTADGTLEIIPKGWLRVSIEGNSWAF